MVAKKHLPNAPIREALVDFRLVARKPFDRPGNRDALGQRLAPHYTSCEEMRRAEAHLGFQKGRPILQSASENAFLGYAFRSADGKDVAQFRVDGFTYNRLAPYVSGDHLIAEAVRLWPLYLEAADPGETKRIAVRYINQMDSASLGAALEWLAAPPPQPVGGLPEIGAFSTRFVSLDPKLDLSIITTSSLGPPMGGNFRLVLDVDASITRDFRSDDVAGLRVVLEQLRELKNRAFFESISERAVERYS